MQEFWFVQNIRKSLQLNRKEKKEGKVPKSLCLFNIIMATMYLLEVNLLRNVNYGVQVVARQKADIHFIRPDNKGRPNLNYIFVSVSVFY